MLTAAIRCRGRSGAQPAARHPRSSTFPPELCLQPCVSGGQSLLLGRGHCSLVNLAELRTLHRSCLHGRPSTRPVPPCLNLPPLRLAPPGPRQQLSRQLPAPAGSLHSPWGFPVRDPPPRPVHRAAAPSCGSWRHRTRSPRRLSEAPGIANAAAGRETVPQGKMQAVMAAQIPGSRIAGDALPDRRGGAQRTAVSPAHGETCV